MAEFTTSVTAQRVARRMLDVAQEAGLFDGGIVAHPQLAEPEKQFFLAMMRETAKHSAEHKGELDPDEISSVFSFVCAKAAEAAARLFENNDHLEFSLDGMFTGHIPISAGEILNAYCKKLTFPTDCARAFLSLAAEPDFKEPLFSLFEALKWVFRLSFHIFWEYLEEYDPDEAGK